MHPNHDRSWTFNIGSVSWLHYQIIHQQVNVKTKSDFDTIFHLFRWWCQATNHQKIYEAMPGTGKEVGNIIKGFCPSVSIFFHPILDILIHLYMSSNPYFLPSCGVLLLFLHICHIHRILFLIGFYTTSSGFSQKFIHPNNCKSLISRSLSSELAFKSIKDFFF